MRTPFSLLLTGAVVTGAVLWASCVRPGPGPEGELDRAQKRWEQQGVTSYSFTLKVSCFCPQEVTTPVTVDVRQGVVVSLVYQPTGAPVERKEFFERYDTVPELFGVVRDAIDRKAEDIRVTYDAVFGYPTEMRIDYSRTVADEELGLTVSGFDAVR